MATSPHPPSALPALTAGPAAWPVCVAAALSLAVAMGIGRFAFTPLLPLMQREGLLGNDGGAWLASVNYVGYLVGALSAARLAPALAAQPRRVLLGCLLATALVTAAAGLTHSLAVWIGLRAAAGVLSAWALVGVSAWSGSELARIGRSDASGFVYSGVGLGIAGVGALAWAAGEQGSAALWLMLGGAAALAALLVQRVWPVPGVVLHGVPTTGSAAPPASLTSPTSPGKSMHGVARGSAGLVLCYACAGFGYILPATYLPSLARTLVDDPRLFGLAWPVFGLAAALSTALAVRAFKRWRLLDVWAACHGLMAVGCALPLVSHSGAAIAASALLVGGSFMVPTLAGLQQARLLCPSNPAPLLGRMTAAFALGQIGGPLLAWALDWALEWAMTGAAERLPGRLPLLGGWSGIELAQALAAASLCATALWLRHASHRFVYHPSQTSHESRAHPTTG